MQDTLMVVIFALGTIIRYRPARAKQRRDSGHHGLFEWQLPLGGRPRHPTHDVVGAWHGPGGCAQAGRA